MEEADMVFSVNDPLPAYIQQGVQRLLNQQQENLAQLRRSDPVHLRSSLDQSKEENVQSKVKVNENKKSELNVGISNKSGSIKMCKRKMISTLDRHLRIFYLLALKNSIDEDEAISQTCDMVLDITKKTILKNKHFEKRNEKDAKPDHPLKCDFCTELLYMPVTLACGHSFCQCCVSNMQELYNTCYLCGKRLPKEKKLKVNVTLMTVIQKICPNGWKARELTVQGYNLLQKQSYQESLDRLTEAIAKNPTSYSAYLIRSKVLLKMRKYEKALEDCTKTVFLSSNCSEAYFVKSQILRRMNLIPHALISILIGLFFEPCRTLESEHLKQFIRSMMNRGTRRKKSKPASKMRAGQKRHCSCSPPNVSSHRYSILDPPSPPMQPLPAKRRRLSESDTVANDAAWDRTPDQTLAMIPSPSQSSDWDSLPVLSLDSVRHRMNPSPLNSTSESSQVQPGKRAGSRKRQLCKDAHRCWFHSHRLTVTLQSGAEEKDVKPSWVTFSSDNAAYNPVVNDDGGNTTTSDDDTVSHAAPSVNSSDLQMLSDNQLSDTNQNPEEGSNRWTEEEGGGGESQPSESDQEEKNQNGNQPIKEEQPSANLPLDTAKVAKIQISEIEVSEQIQQDFVEYLFKVDRMFTGDLVSVCDQSVNDKMVSILELPESTTEETEKVDASDLECSLCMRLFMDPLCTTCGHVFCQVCLERCLDHTLNCPLCKYPLQNYLADSLKSLHHQLDHTTDSLIKHYLMEEYNARKAQHLQEIEELKMNLSIFICTIGFPSVPCPLHIFEPRYRLMLRRCLDHNDRSFGMCMPMPNQQHHNIGTLLKVRNVTFFPDGRSVVDCMGFRRFKTLHSEVVDGYTMAKVQYIKDAPVADEQTMERLIRIHEKVFCEAKEWFKNQTNTVTERIVSHFGNFPEKDNNIRIYSSIFVASENGPNWLWWVLAVIPVELRVKATILGKSSLRERLLIIHRIFVCLAQRPQNNQSRNM